MKRKDAWRALYYIRIKSFMLIAGPPDKTDDNSKKRRLRRAPRLTWECGGDNSNRRFAPCAPPARLAAPCASRRRTTPPRRPRSAHRWSAIRRAGLRRSALVVGGL